MTRLREELQSMTELEDVSQHPAILEEIRRRSAHSILLVQSRFPIAHYTCLMHVMAFAGSKEYQAIASRGLNVVFAGSEFAHWLIERGDITEISSMSSSERKMVFYFADNRFKHAALFKKGHRLVSKWGRGHLYEHEVWEVPKTYGGSIRIFERLTYDKALSQFIRFAKDKGMLL